MKRAASLKSVIIGQKYSIMARCCRGSEADSPEFFVCGKGGFRFLSSEFHFCNFALFCLVCSKANSAKA